MSLEPIAPQKLSSGRRESALARLASEHVDRLLASCDVHVNGSRRHDPQIRDRRFYWRTLSAGTLGVGDSYVDGEWDCEALDELSYRIVRGSIDERLGPSWLDLGPALLARAFNPQARTRTSTSVRAHYDRGNDLYFAMLGPSMVYSCAYWRDARDLEAAQRAKHELVCRKLGLQSGQSLLDVGCGWGELARHAAERHGVRVVGITLSPPQVDLARQRCAGLPVEIRLQDYRELDERFDRIVSIGMFEHVGPRNYARFFATLHRCLADDGLMVLHTIGGLRSRTSIDPWIAKHIFPDAVLPSAKQISEATEGLFVLEDWHSFGADYDKTLLAWHRNFEAAWPSLQRYGERFHRLWRYYLLTCAGAFRARSTQLWQLVLSKGGVAGGYHRPS
jgi:cyclopropane-fatty-acyl-phospholipid synthase